MAVLVTGGAGYIGSHMVLNLTDAGETVVVLDNLVTGFDWAIDHRASFVMGDAGDIEFVSKIIRERKITEIIHFAGSIVVPESVSDPLKYYANDTATSRNLIEIADQDEDNLLDMVRRRRSKGADQAGNSTAMHMRIAAE